VTAPAAEITGTGGTALALIRDVAAGRAVSIAPGVLAALRRQRAEATRALADGRLVYGVNTGMGKLSSVRLTEEQQLSHQRNLMLARATGGPPWLSAAETRAVITARLVTFASGDAAVSAELCLRLADVLNLGLVPAVPRGGAGAAGEIMQLAHAFGPVVGIGRVLRPDGTLTAAGQALREAGLAEFALGPKEGVALIQGVPGATGLCALRLGEIAAVASLMESSAALSILAARASRDPYRAACARGDDVLAAVLGRIRAAAGDEPSPRSLQAPVSFRVAGPVLAQVARAAGLLEAAAGRALAGVTDSPAYLGGQFTGTAGFHGIDLAAYCDLVTAALCHAAEVSAARIHRLMDPAVTGLPAQLARDPGPQAGLAPVHKRAAGEVHAMRRLAGATAVGLIETSAGQEDVQGFAWEATEKLAAALRHAHAVTACELLAGYQAVALSGPGEHPQAGPGEDGQAGPGERAPAGRGRRLLNWLSGLIPAIDGDRPFGEDIERIIAAGGPPA
jgi:histidine ammonia-lyase